MARQDISIGAAPDDKAAGGCGCGCGSADERPASTVTPAAAANTTSYAVSGMTCGHCAGAVTEEVRRLAGVTDVAVDLNAGGLSTVTVTSAGPLDVDAVRQAVDEAGFELAGERT